MTLPQIPQGDRAQTQRSARRPSLSTTQKIIIGVVSGGVLLALIFLIMSSSSADFTVLYSNLSPEDAGRIVEYLKESGAKYKLTSGGKTVMVSASGVYELRMELAAKGYPQGSGSGFELFDKTNFGATEFSQKVNYTRALQGELARTIGSLNQVEQARVHIVIPDERLFAEQQKPTTASIVLKMRPGAYILDAQVRGVVNLVAGAVQGLSPEFITVVDTDGNLLWRGTGSLATATGSGGVGIGNNGAMTSAQLEAKMGFEQEMQRRVETMLDRVLGIGKAVVRVYADISFDSTQRESETYQPLAGGRGVPVAEQMTEERRTGEAQSATGYAGTPSNVENYPVITPVDGSGGSTYTRTDRTVNYEVSKVTEKAVIAPGKVERISVAAMVDGVVTQDRMEAIRQVVSAAVGLKSERGDQVTVSAMEFAKAASDADMAAAADEMAKADGQAFIMRLVRSITPIVLGFLLLVFGLSILRMFRSKPEAVREPVAIGRKVGEVIADQPAAAVSPQAAAARVEEKRKADTRQTVETLARARPEDVARILETWMSED
ncbi:MAG: flagellar basal-body MS-ring/collar protein FliF [Clostridia bacterium]|nr:flagellar basal-body MS-ring/collar protein FliF [Clostridia bacterium]